jgi:HSP20 family molecular chaperone IbpA
MKSPDTVQKAEASPVKIISTDKMTGRGKRIRDLVAQRAYDLYEKRGRVPGHAHDDWSQAEAEITFEPPIGMMQSTKTCNVYAGACGACAGDFEICVEPQRLTLAGRVPVVGTYRKPQARPTAQVFRVIDLPVEVNPSKVRAKFTNGLLEIEMAKRGNEAQTA